MKRLIVRWRDGYCNLPVTHIKREDAIVEAFRGEEFVGFFDLGAIDVLYISDQEREMK